MNVGLLIFYEEVTYVKGNLALLIQLTHHQDHHIQEFKSSLDLWFQPIEDIFFIIRISTRGEYFPYFSNFLPSVASNTQFTNSEIYIGQHNTNTANFQIFGGNYGYFPSMHGRSSASQFWRQHWPTSLFIFHSIGIQWPSYNFRIILLYKFLTRNNDNLSQCYSSIGSNILEAWTHTIDCICLCIFLPPHELSKCDTTVTTLCV